MKIQELKESVQKVITIRDQVRELKKTDRYSYTLGEYLVQFRERLNFVDHGERDRFSSPAHFANVKLSELTSKAPDELELRFSASKAKLLSIMSEYIKDMNRGFVEHELEQKSNGKSF